MATAMSALPVSVNRVSADLGYQARFGPESSVDFGVMGAPGWRKARRFCRYTHHDGALSGMIVTPKRRRGQVI